MVPVLIFKYETLAIFTSIKNKPDIFSWNIHSTLKIIIMIIGNKKFRKTIYEKTNFDKIIN